VFSNPLSSDDQVQVREVETVEAVYELFQGPHSVSHTMDVSFEKGGIGKLMDSLVENIGDLIKANRDLFGAGDIRIVIGVDEFRFRSEHVLTLAV
jgi:hypothetical protein